MKQAFISLSGLLHKYEGTEKEYPKWPARFDHAQSCEDFERDCILVEDQERALELLRLHINKQFSGKLPLESNHTLPTDRTLYFIEAPEMRKVEQYKVIKSNSEITVNGWVTIQEGVKIVCGNVGDVDHRTVYRFVENANQDMRISNNLIEAVHVVARINACLEDTNESSQVNYLILRTSGDIFEIKWLSEYIFSSENDTIEDVKTCDNAHGGGLWGKQLEQFLWDKMIDFVRDIEKESKYIYSYSSKGRGLAIGQD